MSRQRQQRNAADATEVGRADSSAKRAAARDALDWRELASSEGGRRILAWLLEPIGALSYRPHANDTAYYEGMRAMARNVRAKLCQHVPDVLVLLASAEVEQLQRLALPAPPDETPADP